MPRAGHFLLGHGRGEPLWRLLCLWSFFILQSCESVLSEHKPGNMTGQQTCFWSFYILKMFFPNFACCTLDPSPFCVFEYGLFLEISLCPRWSCVTFTCAVMFLVRGSHTPASAVPSLKEHLVSSPVRATENPSASAGRPLADLHQWESSWPNDSGF